VRHNMSFNTDALRRPAPPALTGARRRLTLRYVSGRRVHAATVDSSGGRVMNWDQAAWANIHTGQ